MEKNYYLGLDIGTDSVGWAVTDEEYNLFKEKGKDFWGAYLFDTAQTAQDRRQFRANRRRIARIRQRIKLLQEIFSPEIAKNDFSFFIRLNESAYTADDKGVDGIDSLFHDVDFTDKDYFKKYPTIYHLRAAFLDKKAAKEITDIRLLYLAVHHIIKNRGHFLFEDQVFHAQDKNEIRKSFSELNDYLVDDIEDSFTFCRIDELICILLKKDIGKNDKEKEIKNLYGPQNRKIQAIIRAIIGKKVSFKDLFEDYDCEELKDFCFSNDSFAEDKIKECCGSDQYVLIEILKKIYDWAVLAGILNGQEFISYAMVNKYEQHKADLRLLKDYIAKNYPEKYKEVFHEKYLKDGKIILKNYAAYVGLCGREKGKKISKDEFYKYLKSFVKDETILQRIEQGTFLSKPRSNENGVIPYQLHKIELECILENAVHNFPFLENESDGIKTKDKIISLLTFRIPYYVGPLNDLHSKSGQGFAWVKKYSGRENEKITPWNFDSIIDKNASEEEFIKRMTNKCQYLIGEDVLPKASLAYSEFDFLNQLNNLSYGGKRLDKKAREIIYDYAQHNKKITIAKIGKLLEINGLIEKGSGKKENFGGYDNDFKASLSSWIFMREVFGDKFNLEMCEKIILWFTVMSDKNRIADRIKREYDIDEDTIKKLKQFNCSGWGRLSLAFLTKINGIDKNGEIMNILSAMRETGCNLMELLSSDFTFSDEIKKFNDERNNCQKINYQTIEDLYCSPSVKRAIWRTICLTREIEKIEGKPPKKIFVEMARGAEEDKKGVRTKSRKEQIIELYRNIELEKRDWLREIDTVSDTKFFSDKLVLYYRQMGKCAYTGQAIALSDVFNVNVCDIDHIYPQSKIKDDSLDNRVLSLKIANSAKSDKYPISEDVRKKMLSTWCYWHENGLISDEKFYRLSRVTPLSTEEVADFIQRQLVETRQSTKIVASILKELYPKSVVVYSKARNVSNFRHEFGLVKVRELNDLHHAKDAYLNIVVGNVYNVKFNGNARWYFENNTSDTSVAQNLFKKDLKGAWIVANQNKILETAKKNTCRIVRFTSEGHGGFFDATIKAKGANDKLIPLKSKEPYINTDKYGGYDSAATAYFSLVKSIDKKGKKVISLEAIPIYINRLGENAVKDYLIRNAKLNQPEILIKEIKLNSLLNINGAYVWLRGKTGERFVLCNANELLLDEENTVHLKKIISLKKKQKELRKEFAIDPLIDKIDYPQNMTLYRALYKKLSEKPFCNLTIGQKAQTLQEKENVFANLSLEDQCTVLLEILNFMKCDSTTANLTLLGGSAGEGSLKRNKFLKKDEKITLITQSPTGYYRSVINLTDYYNK